MLSEFLDHVKSFALARVLMTSVEIDLFPVLEAGPRSRADLKKQLEIADTSIADAFFDTLLAFNVIAEQNGKLVLQPLARSILPAYESIRSWNKEMQLFYDSLVGLTGLLQAGDYRDSALAKYWIYKQPVERSTISAVAVEEYSKIMDQSQAQLSRLIADGYDFNRHHHVIDFGGGTGRLAMTLAERYPELKITVADLPSVCNSARVQVANLGDRIDFMPVDFFKDDLPSAVADAILFVRVLHDWNDMEVMELVKRSRQCLRGRGSIVVVEPMWIDDEKNSRGAVLSALMVTLFGGKRRSVEEYMKILRSVGYAELAWTDLGLSLYKTLVGQVG